MTHSSKSPTTARQQQRGVLDLTHALAPNIPNWDNLPTAVEVSIEETLEKDAFFSRRISLNEHTGTHFDAPAHVVAGGRTVEQIAPGRLVRPLIVIDVRKQVEHDADYVVTVADVTAWEKQHGEMPHGAVVLACTGWDVRWSSPASFRNADAKGVMHFPGFAEKTAVWLIEHRDIAGLGVDTLSVDPGNSGAYPVHKCCAAHGVYHLECVANLADAPPSGATVVIAPMKLAGGSGAPARILALLP